MKSPFFKLALVGMTLLFATAPLGAATITVDTLDGSGGPNNECALAQAVVAAGLNLALAGCTAGSASDTDTIVFDPTLFGGGSATINLDNPLNALGGGLIIDGPNNAELVVNGNGSDAVITVNMTSNGELTLRDFTLRNGVADGVNGAGIRILGSNEGDLVLEDMSLRDHANLSANGGAIGGVFQNDIRIDISDTTFSDNSAAGDGGAFAMVSADTASVLLVISGVTFADNDAGGNGGALALQLPSGNGSVVLIHDARFDRNLAGLASDASEDSEGGAAWISGLAGGPDDLDIKRSHFVRNTARGSGGALSATGVRNLAISQSVFEVNLAAKITPSPEIRQSGGALDWQAGGTLFAELVIRQSTFDSNFARLSGGAVTASDGGSVIVNSTFHRNTVDSDGGQALLLSGRNHELLFNTFTDNNRQTIADFTIRANESASVALGHNILWHEAGIAPICHAASGAAFSSLGYNLVNDGSCASGQTDLVGVDPRLGILRDYGSPAMGIVVKTRLPLPGSPVIDGGDISCPGPGTAERYRGAGTPVDQRGKPRPQFGPDRGGSALCDIGSVEYQPGAELEDAVFSDRFEAQAR
jgi:predicted outer membrane repeat protein